MNAPLQKLRQLILPPRPDPARSRRIAEGRLMIGCFVAFGIFITIGVRIVGLADAGTSTHLAQSAAAGEVHAPGVDTQAHDAGVHAPCIPARRHRQRAADGAEGLAQACELG